jgi:hypothetical protein
VAGICDTGCGAPRRTVIIELDTRFAAFWPCPFYYGDSRLLPVATMWNRPSTTDR